MQIDIDGRRIGRRYPIEVGLVGDAGETLRALFAPAPLIDIYGLTETSTCDFFLMPSDVPRYAGCIGRPSPGVKTTCSVSM